MADASAATRHHILVVGPERIGLMAQSYPKYVRAVLASHQVEVLDVRVANSDSYDDIDLADLAPDTTDLLILNSHVPTHAWANLTELRRVVKLGRLRLGIDVTELTLRRVRYQQLADPSAISVAEHAFLLMLACARRLDEALVVPGQARPAGWPRPILTTQNARLTNWLSLEATNFRLLAESHLGIIGLGEIGLEIGSRGRALGMQVAYNNRRRLSPTIEAAHDLRYLSKPELLASSSVVVVSTTAEVGDAPALGVDEVRGLPDDTIVINIGRGAAVSQTELVKRARRSTRGGLGLDVYAIEPVDPEEFVGCHNTVLTAHVASVIPPALRFEAFARGVRDLLDETRGR